MKSGEELYKKYEQVFFSNDKPKTDWTEEETYAALIVGLKEGFCSMYNTLPKFDIYSLLEEAERTGKKICLIPKETGTIQHYLDAEELEVTLV